VSAFIYKRLLDDNGNLIQSSSKIIKISFPQGNEVYLDVSLEKETKDGKFFKWHIKCAKGK
jgi:hypothetical protein